MLKSSKTNSSCKRSWATYLLGQRILRARTDVVSRTDFSLQKRNFRLSIWCRSKSSSWEQLGSRRNGLCYLLFACLVLAPPSLSDYSYCLETWHWARRTFDLTQQSCLDVLGLSLEEFAPPLLLHTGIKLYSVQGHYSAMSLLWNTWHWQLLEASGGFQIRDKEDNKFCRSIEASSESFAPVMSAGSGQEAAELGLTLNLFNLRWGDSAQTKYFQQKEGICHTKGLIVPKFFFNT